MERRSKKEEGNFFLYAKFTIFLVYKVLEDDQWEDKGKEPIRYRAPHRRSQGYNQKEKKPQGLPAQTSR